jgi:HD-GYP domain-containing protein (c-di-GMP phosphodiesterase class II)
MKANLGIISDLVETFGRMSRYTFHWVSGAATTASCGGLSQTDVHRLAEEADRTGGAVCIEAENGSWACGVPVPAEDGGQGLLVTYASERHRQDSQRPTDLLRLLGQVRQLIEERHETTDERLKMAEELNQAYEDLHLFSRIATQIRSLRFSRPMLRDLLQEVRESMRADLAVATFDGRPEDNILIAGADFSGIVPDATRFLAELGAEMPRSAPAIEEGCFIVNCSTELPAFRGMHPAAFRALAIRVQSANQEYGWLLLVSFNMREIFRRGEYRLLRTVAEQVALLRANSALYSNLESFVINLVKSLVMAIEAKDAYTKGHSERVSAYCLRMAADLGLDEKLLTDLQWASVLHDLGKIGTPEVILNKPDRLSANEYDCIKGHPAKGAEILLPIAQLEDALPAIRHHHEQYDGRGYPDALRGDSIPLLARIIAVADTYDAITSRRAYREAGSHEKAMRIIREGAGSQFDPKVVDAFCRIVGDGRAVFDTREATAPNAEAVKREYAGVQA